MRENMSLIGSKDQPQYFKEKNTQIKSLIIQNNRQKKNLNSERNKQSMLAANTGNVNE